MSKKKIKLKRSTINELVKLMGALENSKNKLGAGERREQIISVLTAAVQSSALSKKDILTAVL